MMRILECVRYRLWPLPSFAGLSALSRGQSAPAELAQRGLDSLSARLFSYGLSAKNLILAAERKPSDQLLEAAKHSERFGKYEEKVCTQNLESASAQQRACLAG